MKTKSLADSIKELAEKVNPQSEILKKEEKPTAPKRQTGKIDEYAYTITDKNFGELKVLNSANAWWLDKAKVHDLINAYKIDCPDEEAIFNAGISIDQLKYFNELHPEFSTIKATCKQYPNVAARQRAVKGINESYANSMDYLKRKKKLEFGDSSAVDVTTKGESLNTADILKKEYGDR